MATSMGFDVAETVEQAFREISTQFMEMVPIRRMKWKGPHRDRMDISYEIQRKVLKATVHHPVAKKFPPTLSYRRAFMKQFLHKLEATEVEICDEVYEAYTELLSQTEEEDDTLCYKTYTLPSGSRINLQESVHLISQGTTGLSTWQAAEHLAEWVFEHPEIVKNKRVLELGSGLGLTGIATCRQCCPKHYTFTDCHPQVLFLLTRNLEHNFQESSQRKDNKRTPCNGSHKDATIIKKIRRQLSLTADSMSLTIDHADISEICISPTTPPGTECEIIQRELSHDLAIFELNNKVWLKDDTAMIGTLKRDERVSLAKLDWEDLDQRVVDKLRPDVLLAADIVFDPTIIPALILVLKQFLMRMDSETPVAYVASTIRNEDTRDKFLVALAAEGLLYSEVDPPVKQHFHYDRSVPIEIIKIYTKY